MIIIKTNRNTVTKVKGKQRKVVISCLAITKTQKQLLLVDTKKKKNNKGKRPFFSFVLLRI